MKFSNSLSNICGALAKVQAEIRNPIKNQINKGVQGAPMYANLEDTLQDFVRPVLAKHGMSVVQSVKSDEQGRPGVCTVLFHESGEFIEGDYVFAEVKIPTNNSGREILTVGQACGVNITYLRRYSLNAALGINGDKDTDGSYGEAEPKHEAPKAKEIKCQRCGNMITGKIVKGQPLTPEQIAANALKQYGAELCWECACEAKKDQALQALQ